MFSKLSIIALATSLATGVTAIGSARVVNNCPFEVTVWSVGSTASDPTTLAASGGKYSEQFVVDKKSGGRTLKITRDADGLYTGKPQTNYAYNLDNSRVWYDLNDVFGDAFDGHKVILSPDNGYCPSVVWDKGVSPEGSQIRNCDADSNVTLSLCA